MENKWISVKDELPNDPEWVLVYAGGAMNCMAFYRGKFEDWTHPAAGNIIDDITHWMRLTPPAKTERKGEK